MELISQIEPITDLKKVKKSDPGSPEPGIRGSRIKHNNWKMVRGHICTNNCMNGVCGYLKRRAQSNSPELGTCMMSEKQK